MKKMKIVVGVLLALLVLTGFLVYKALSGPKVNNQPSNEEEMTQELLPEVDSSVSVDLIPAAKANTLTLKVTGLADAYTSIGYEFSYESKGLIKGVNSGSKPLDVTGKSSFDREVYLGTCSKNDCTPDVGVTKVTVVLEFTAVDGKKSQFTKDFDL